MTVRVQVSPWIQLLTGLSLYMILLWWMQRIWRPTRWFRGVIYVCSGLLVYHLGVPLYQRLSKHYSTTLHLSSFATEGRYQQSYQDHYDPQCMICLETLHPQDLILELKCGCQRLYHKDCLLPWIQSHMTCPVCHCLLDELMLP